MIRSLPGPVFFPLRALAIVYADFFRGVPTILVIAMLGFGAPALAARRACRPRRRSGGSSRSSLIYTAYVSEVYRAGIESVHPSQEAAARSLGLTRGQALRLRDPAAGGAARDPAAPERLHRPAEGHGARRDARRVEAFNQAQIDANATFNYTPYLAAALLFVAITIPLARFTDWLIAARPAAPAGRRESR